VINKAASALGWQSGMSQDEAMSHSEEIRPVALTIF